MISTQAEDYLKCIYILQENGAKVRNSLIAQYLEVSPATVTEMLQKLSKNRLIDYKPYSEVKLTDKGLKLAKKLIWKHRIIECFLRDILGYEDLNKIHLEACRLEHATSEEFILRLCKILNNPEVCPHGKKIPKIEK